ncbi:SDR family NAD(P)-dependent oxidoreductase [Actinoplanes sp. L3-i22]|uniref:type I polyketide synthase n=1 Tax=Actinoplanes sp. L3-i22 TaxID=2836373 RepID=UPI001C764C95|nr:type I polyketide synthase [Actinoplanes sp. L3-i22]BCY09671.1 polyketide synthase [Actinoplanes sp. L3-i22]
MARRNSRYGTGDIAIVGMSGRFPGAEDVDEFWANVRDGVESISFFTPDQLAAAGTDPAVLRNPDFVAAGSVLTGIDLFDADFFGYSPREAESLDPQQRLFLETCWHALENAGYDSETYPGLVGVYAGCAMSTYLYLLQSNPEFMALLGYLQVHIGNDKDYLTTHVSYKLDLRGPSFNIQTACSTSLLAVAVAADHLVTGQCDMALAGGVCVRIPQEAGYYFEPGGIYSPDGHCRVFDERAEGVVFGSGVGAVVLKRLDDAVADGDSILAVVRGWAVNNDGADKISYTAPGLAGQVDVITRAHRRARVRPGTISYIEAHGTGTPVGDPIEIQALSDAFRTGTSKRNFCAVGSVKTNVGHLDPAAGVASLIKTVLALRHRQLPPSLNCDTPNPKIDFAGSPFYVNTELADWPRNGTPRRAGVSGFGIGGTNVHLVVEEAPAPASRPDPHEHHLLVLSARSDAALDASIENLSAHLTRDLGQSAAEIAYTSQVGRRAFRYRCAVVGQDVPDLAGALAADDRRRVLRAANVAGRPSVAFLFPGQGSQYATMTAGLYESEPVFREQLDHCAAVLSAPLGRDLRDLLYPAAGADPDGLLTRTRFAQPALFAVEYALARLWTHWGVRPDAMLGHSIGEYVAACLAGVFDLDDALALVAERGRLMQQLPAGAMLAVARPPDEVLPLLDGRLDLAARNEPSSCVVSGDSALIGELQDRLDAAGIASSRLHTSHAFHSRMMEPILAPFTAAVARIGPERPRIPYLSNVTGDWITDAEATSPEYWARHLRRPVRFADGLGRLLSEPGRLLLEVGPGQSLSTFARRHPDHTAQQPVVTSVRHPQEPRADRAVLLESVARVWLAGVPVDWSALHGDEHPRRVPLPGYPFERQRYWPEAADGDAPAAPEILKEPDVTDWFYVPSWEYSLTPEPAAVPGLLLFDDGSAVGRAVVERQRRDDAPCVVVRAGERFAAVAPDTYEIRPDHPEDYVALLDALTEPVARILHLWSLGPPAGFDADQQHGFYSLLYLAQALGRRPAHDPVQIVAGTNDLHPVTGEERVEPGRAPLIGVCLTVPQEHPHLRLRSVDVEIGPDDRAGAAAAGQLIAEFGDPEVHPTVAYRMGQRWLQTYEPMPLDEPDGAGPLRESGVYLITGGLGAIGLSLAEHLAETVHARLVLVGRSPFPEPDDWDSWLAAHAPDDPVSVRIARLRAMLANGAEVLVRSADVADPARLRAVVDEARTRFGGLDGVIHGAGNVTADGFFDLDEAGPERCERQFGPKVRGLVALAEAIEGTDPAFVVLLSSISSVLGGLGYVAYAAANLFLDSFAYQRGRSAGVPWVSIAWDTWETDPAVGLPDDPTRLSMSPAEGVDAFRRVLTSALLPQVVVSTGDLPARVDQWVNLRSVRDAADRRDRRSARLHSRPDLSTSYLAPRTDVEKAIAEIWQETLGVAQIGILDHFFTDLGGSSLIATQVVAQVRDRFQVTLPLRRFFEGPTVAEIAGIVDAARGGTP